MSARLAVGRLPGETDCCCHGSVLLTSLFVFFMDLYKDVMSLDHLFWDAFEMYV